jgi:hypothetical protein
MDKSQLLIRGGHKTDPRGYEKLQKHEADSHMSIVIDSRRGADA